jgi:hypothetical protein
MSLPVAFLRTIAGAPAGTTTTLKGTGTPA